MRVPRWLGRVYAGLAAASTIHWAFSISAGIASLVTAIALHVIDFLKTMPVPLIVIAGLGIALLVFGVSQLTLQHFVVPWVSRTRTYVGAPPQDDDLFKNIYLETGLGKAYSYSHGSPSLDRPVPSRQYFIVRNVLVVNNTQRSIFLTADLEATLASEDAFSKTVTLSQTANFDGNCPGGDQQQLPATIPLTPGGSSMGCAVYYTSNLSHKFPKAIIALAVLIVRERISKKVRRIQVEIDTF